jgi:hypothetical protein
MPWPALPSPPSPGALPEPSDCCGCRCSEILLAVCSSPFGPCIWTENALFVLQEPDEPTPLCPGGLGYRARLFWGGSAQGFGVVCGDACYGVTLVSGTAEVWVNDVLGAHVVGDFFDDAAGSIGYGDICCDQPFSAWVEFNAVLNFPIQTFDGTVNKQCAVVGSFFSATSPLAPCPVPCTDCAVAQGPVTITWQGECLAAPTNVIDFERFDDYGSTCSWTWSYMPSVYDWIIRVVVSYDGVGFTAWVQVRRPAPTQGETTWQSVLGGYMPLVCSGGVLSGTVQVPYESNAYGMDCGIGLPLQLVFG